MTSRESLDAAIEAAARVAYPNAPQHEAVTKFLDTEEGQGLYTLRDTLEKTPRQLDRGRRI